MKDTSHDPYLLYEVNPETNEQEVQVLYHLEIFIKLSERRIEQERHRYTFVDLLADFGGFNDGIIMIASVFMAPYSGAMFSNSLSQHFPVRKKGNSIPKPRRKSQAALLRKITAGRQIELDRAQAETLDADLFNIVHKKIRVSFCKSFRCVSYFLSGRDP